MTVVLLSKPSCVQCNASKRDMDRKGVEYATTDLTEDPSALELAKALGYLSAPVTLVYDDENGIIDHWAGFRPDKIQEIAA